MTIMENGALAEIIERCYILAEAGIKVDFDVRVIIILRADKIHPFVVKEMLMPILRRSLPSAILTKD